MARIDSLGALDATTARLQSRDRERLETIASEKRRRELLAGRRLLQQLAAHLNLQVAFDGAEGAAGVVVCGNAPGDARLSASMTHAGPWIACALGAGDGIGIDLEVLTERDFIALAEASFPDSIASFETLSSEDRKIVFYRRWTQHEAAIKCGALPGHRVTWLLPGQWVLSLNWSSAVASVSEPLLWDERAAGFRSLDLEVLDRPQRNLDE